MTNLFWSEWTQSGGATDAAWCILANVEDWMFAIAQCVPDENTAWRDRIWSITHKSYAIASGYANGTEQAQRCAIGVFVAMTK